MRGADVAEIDVRRYEPGDREPCLALFEANCPEFFAANERDDYVEFLSSLASLAASYNVCMIAGRIAGAYGLEPHDGTLALRWILLSPAVQGRGVGTAIMARVLDEARRQGAGQLHIAASQKSAPFFARFGAAELARIADGWGPEMDRVDMCLHLGP
jgi:GNAT superfamily N-acetyltransferase